MGNSHKNILSATSSSIRTKLWWNRHWMVLFQNCVRQSRSPTKRATTVQLCCYWKQLWSRWAITGSWEPLVLVCLQCCCTFPCFSWSLVDVLTRLVLTGNYENKILLTLFVSAIKCLTWSHNDFVNIKRKIYDVIYIHNFQW